MEKYVEFIQFIHRYWNDQSIDKGLKEVINHTCCVVAIQPTVTTKKDSSIDVTWDRKDARLLKPQSCTIHIPADMGGVFCPKSLPSPSHNWHYLHPLHAQQSSAKASSSHSISEAKNVKSIKGKERKGEKSRQPKGKEVVAPLPTGSGVSATSLPLNWVPFLLSIGCTDTIQTKLNESCELSDLLHAIETMGEREVEKAFRSAESLLSSLDRMFQMYDGVISKDEYTKIMRSRRWCPGILKGKKFLSFSSSLYRSDMNATNMNVYISLNDALRKRIRCFSWLSNVQFSFIHLRRSSIGAAHTQNIGLVGSLAAEQNPSPFSLPQDVLGIPRGNHCVCDYFVRVAKYKTTDMFFRNVAFQLLGEWSAADRNARLSLSSSSEPSFSFKMSFISALYEWLQKNSRVFFIFEIVDAIFKTNSFKDFGVFCESFLPSVCATHEEFDHEDGAGSWRSKHIR
jgi:hypothetical protein